MFDADVGVTKALDIFAAFFKSPLLKAESIQKEVRSGEMGLCSIERGRVTGESHGRVTGGLSEISETMWVRR